MSANSVSPKPSSSLILYEPRPPFVSYIPWSSAPSKRRAHSLFSPSHKVKLRKKSIVVSSFKALENFPLLNLPPEIVLGVARQCSTSKDIANIASTCKYLHDLLHWDVIESAVLNETEGKEPPIAWAICKDRLDFMQEIIAHVCNTQGCPPMPRFFANSQYDRFRSKFFKRNRVHLPQNPINEVFEFEYLSDTPRKSLLSWAFRHGNIAAVKILLENGASCAVPFPLEHWSLALQSSCFVPALAANGVPYASHGSLEMLKLVLDTGVDPNTLGRDGYNALHSVCRLLTVAPNADSVINGYYHHVRETGRRGYPMSLCKPPEYRLRVDSGLEMMKLLLEKGADINGLTSNGGTVLHVLADTASARRSHAHIPKKVLKFLVANDADRDAIDDQGILADEILDFSLAWSERSANIIEVMHFLANF